MTDPVYQVFLVRAPAVGTVTNFVEKMESLFLAIYLFRFLPTSHRPYERIYRWAVSR